MEKRKDIVAEPLTGLIKPPDSALRESFRLGSFLERAAELHAAVTARMLNDHRSAVEAGDAVRMIVLLRLCERENLNRPEWLDGKLAEWAAARLSGKGKKKLGRHADPRTEAEDLIAKLETYWTYETIKELRQEGEAYARGETSLTLTADVLNIPEGTAKKRIEAIRSQVREHASGAQMAAFSRIDIPVSRALTA